MCREWNLPGRFSCIALGKKDFIKNCTTLTNQTLFFDFREFPHFFVKIYQKNQKNYAWFRSWIFRDFSCGRWVPRPSVMGIIFAAVPWSDWGPVSYASHPRTIATLCRTNLHWDFLFESHPSFSTLSQTSHTAKKSVPQKSALASSYCHE